MQASIYRRTDYGNYIRNFEQGCRAGSGDEFALRRCIASGGGVRTHAESPRSQTGRRADPCGMGLCRPDSGSVPIEWQTYPGSQPNPDFLDDLKAQVDKDAVVMFLCRSGARSHAAAARSPAGTPAATTSYRASRATRTRTVIAPRRGAGEWRDCPGCRAEKRGGRGRGRGDWMFH